MPGIHQSAFIHPLAYLAGDVTVGARVSVWPFASIRGDSDVITIGDDSNVQDGCVIHCDAGVPCHIGRRVGIGHRAVVHGAVVEDDVLIAMGAVLLNGVRVGTGSIIGPVPWSARASSFHPTHSCSACRGGSCGRPRGTSAPASQAP